MTVSSKILLLMLLVHLVQSSNKFLPHINFLIQDDSTQNQPSSEVQEVQNTQAENTSSESQPQGQPPQPESQPAQPESQPTESPQPQNQDPDQQMLKESEYRSQNNLGMAGDYKDASQKCTSKLYDANNNPLYIPKSDEQVPDYEETLAHSQPLFSDDMLNMNVIEVTASSSQEFIDLAQFDKKLSTNFQQVTYEKMVQPTGDCLILYSECNFEGYGKKVCLTTDDPMDANYTIQSIYIPEGLNSDLN